MNGTEVNKFLEIGIEAALKAGEAIMKIYDTSFEVEIKADNSPLTLADKEANTIINSFLEQTNLPVISEENKQIPYSIRKKWDTCWVVDPVDGTKEFIKRNGEFTVNIALVHHKKPILGVIYVPAETTLYFANTLDQEAFKAKLSTHQTTVKEVYRTAELLQTKINDATTVRVVGSRSHINTETLDFVNNLKNSGKQVNIVSKGSSLKFCLVAEDKADVYPRYAPTMEWDTAAGQAICYATGIAVISQDTKKPLLYNKENLLNPWFVVSKA